MGDRREGKRIHLKRRLNKIKFVRIEAVIVEFSEKLEEFEDVVENDGTAAYL